MGGHEEVWHLGRPVRRGPASLEGYGMWTGSAGEYREEVQHSKVGISKKSLHVEMRRRKNAEIHYDVL